MLAEELRTFTQELAFDREYRLLAADGAVVWVWERDTVVRDETAARSGDAAASGGGSIACRRI